MFTARYALSPCIKQTCLAFKGLNGFFCGSSIQEGKAPPSIPMLRYAKYKHMYGRLRLKCDGTRAETRFRLSVKRTSLFQSAGSSVQSTTGNRGVRHQR